MDEKDFKRFMVPVLIGVLAILSFLVIRPLGTSIFMGLLLAYLFHNLYVKLNQKWKSENLSASAIVISVLVVLVTPIAILTPIFVKQLYSAYMSLRVADFSAIIFKIVPSLASSKEMTAEVIATASHFNAKISSILLGIFESVFQNIPALLFGVVVVLFTFYFGLREGHKFKEYISIVFPIPKEHKRKLYEKFQQVTDSVLYGELVVGLAQGVIAGIGYYMFGVPNALLLTVLTAIAGVVPVVGPWFVWVPVDFFLFLNGNNVAGMQLLIYGLFVVNWIDTLLRPIIIAQRAEMNAALALIGAIGGVYAFGVIGFVVGPLVLAYLILLIEMYKEDKSESIVIKEEKPPLMEEKK
jgi:predicted PurR-regulated permease PerM